MVLSWGILALSFFCALGVSDASTSCTFYSSSYPFRSTSEYCEYGCCNNVCCTDDAKTAVAVWVICVIVVGSLGVVVGIIVCIVKAVNRQNVTVMHSAPSSYPHVSVVSTSQTVATM